MSEVQKILNLLDDGKGTGILNPAFRLDNGDLQTGNSIRILEEGHKAKLTSVQITGLPRKVVTLKPDKITTPSKRRDMLNPSAEKINAAPDGLIFLEHNQKGYVILCELKSSLPHVDEYKNKFKAAACFLDYLAKLLEEFHNIKFDEHFERKYWVFYLEKEGSLQNFRVKNPHPLQIRHNKVKMKAFRKDFAHVQVSELLTRNN